MVGSWGCRRGGFVESELRVSGATGVSEDVERTLPHESSFSHEMCPRTTQRRRPTSAPAPSDAARDDREHRPQDRAGRTRPASDRIPIQVFEELVEIFAAAVLVDLQRDTVVPVGAPQGHGPRASAGPDDPAGPPLSEARLSRRVGPPG